MATKTKKYNIVVDTYKGRKLVSSKKMETGISLTKARHILLVIINEILRSNFTSTTQAAKYMIDCEKNGFAYDDKVVKIVEDKK